MPSLNHCLIVVLLVLPIGAVSAQCDQIVIVRHAEKANDGTSDPPLTNAGQARAKRLAEILTGARVAALYATQYQRTQQTLAPLAAQTGLPIIVRPITSEGPRDHAVQLAQEILSSDNTGTVVIAGHSNTVDDLTVAFNATPVDELAHSDYDSLFLLQVCGERTNVLRRDYTTAIRDSSEAW
jgi:phosphohistidine phosphatase SixA